MKTYKEIKIPAVPVQPARTKQVIDQWLCDLCHKSMSSGCTSETTMIRHHTSRGVDGPSDVLYDRTHFVDMCGRCFHGPFKEWLQSRGVEFQFINHLE